MPIGAKIVGSSVVTGQEAAVTSGFNWFLAANLQYKDKASIQTKVAELFPEDILKFVYDKLQDKRLSVRTLCSGIQDSTFSSASIVSVQGVLRVTGVQCQRQYNPFDPPQIEIEKTYDIYGEQCFIAELDADGFRFPVYFSVQSKEFVCYCIDKPVEVVGVLKWSPPFEVAGFSVNLVLLGAAVLLQK